MSEYWKSNPRKFCEYCKCWFADNKSSIQFHEGGKRHKEAVQAKISELQRKGVKDAKDKARFKTDMEKMEEAAMAALRADIKRDPSLAAAYGLKIQESGCAPMPSNFAEKEPEPELEPEPKVKKKRLWKELKSPEGYSYFWDMENNDTTWTKPDDFEEPELTPEPEPAPEAKTKPVKKTKKTVDKPLAATTTITCPSTIPLPSASIVPTPGGQPWNQPAERRPEKRPAEGAYGSWQTVEEEEEEYPDWQLPPPAEARITPQSSAYSEPPKINFKQKTFKSSADTGGAPKTGIVFKKRKVNSGNMRTRDES